jgi:hypothetical protein
LLYLLIACLTQIRKKAKRDGKEESLTLIGWDHNQYSHIHQCVNYNFDRNDSKNNLLIL